MSFTASATGVPTPTYQWQVSTDGGTTYTNVVDGNGVSGSATNTLSSTRATIAMNGYKFVLIATNNVSSVTSNPATLTVARRTLTFTGVGASSRAYDGTTVGTVNISGATLTGVLPGDDVSLTTATAVAVFSDPSVGNGKTVSISGLGLTGTNAADYQLSTSTATVTANITPATVIPVVSVAGKTYDTTTAATIASRSLLGVIGSDSVQLAGGIANFDNANAGTNKTVTVTGLTLTGGAAANYVLNSSTATTTGSITSAPAGVALSNLTQVFNGSAKAVTATTTPAGLSVAITYSGLPTAPINGGTYPVVATITDPNYTGSTTGNLTISPGPQAITFGTLPTKTIGDPDFALAATASSGLTVTYTSSNLAVATIVSGNMVHLVGPGTTTITASQSGNANYAAATAVGQVLTVLGTAPAFTQQPTPATKTVAPSGVASFSVVATGIPAPTLRWQYLTTDVGATWTDVPNVTPYAGITTATLQIRGAQQAQDGYQFRCVANNGVGGDIVSNPATLHVNVDAPLFTKNPTDQTVTEGGNVSWTVVATGNPAPTFQWQVSADDVTWTNLTDAAPYAGTTTATLAITSTPLSLNGKYFRCVATNSLDACTSFVAKLTVNPLVPVTSAPVIWEDPVNRVAPIGGSALFSVSGTGSPGPTYQWYHDGTAVAGATNFTLDLENVQLADAGSYDVSLTNSIGSVTSKPATLTIDSSPIITAQPAGAAVTAGGSVSFSVTAEGVTPLSYQWRKNGTAISGATGTTLTISNAQSTDAGAYDVVVTNSLGTKTSDSALLAVNAKSYAGQYFGTLSGGGTWALNVNADNTGTFIAYLPDRTSGIVTNVVIDASGSFSADTTEIGTSSSASLSVNGRTVAAAVADLSVAGTITGGKVTGTIGGIGESLTGSVDIGVNGEAGYYKAVALGTTQAATYSVVGASGKTLVVATTPTSVDALSGTLGNNGQLSGTTTDGAQLSVSISPASGSLAATYASPSASALQFSGLSSTVASTTRLANLSARAAAGTGSGTLIVGFTVTGTGPEPLLIRGVGPALTPFGITTPLADPVLSLYSGQTRLATNDNWSSDVNAAQAATVAAELNAFPLPAGGLDAALLTSRDPGVYTAVVSGNGNANGVALAEIYDAAGGGGHLTNLSARGEVGNGSNVLIVGFVVTGNAPKQYLVRAIGPSLTQFGVTGVLANPQLMVVQQGTSAVMAQNDDWSGAASLQTAFDTVNAFALDPSSKDAATLVTLSPGNYSAVISGVNNATGVALVEVYEMP